MCAQMHTDERNKILRGVLAPGHSIGYHIHDTSSEIIFFLSGNGKTKFFSRKAEGYIHLQDNIICRGAIPVLDTREEGEQVGRACILDDGSYHYVLSVLAQADRAAELEGVIADLFRSYSLS